ncbi:MAG: hypothetical protein LBM38_03150 [Clostridiales bacterium]|jgi:hypothetical protein|nr:hypothetical protein [Clostridiales bacterium]
MLSEYEIKKHSHAFYSVCDSIKQNDDAVKLLNLTTNEQSKAIEDTIIANLVQIPGSNNECTYDPKVMKEKLTIAFADLTIEFKQIRDRVDKFLQKNAKRFNEEIPKGLQKHISDSLFEAINEYGPYTDKDLAELFDNSIFYDRYCINEYTTKKINDAFNEDAKSGGDRTKQLNELGEETKKKMIEELKQVVEEKMTGKPDNYNTPDDINNIIMNSFDEKYKIAKTNQSTFSKLSAITNTPSKTPKHKKNNHRPAGNGHRH